MYVKNHEIQPPKCVHARHTEIGPTDGRTQGLCTRLAGEGADSAISRGQKEGKEAAIAYYMKGYDVPRNWCESAFDPQKIEEDSLFNLTLDIHTTDIHNLKPNARFIMFDACFNG